MTAHRNGDQVPWTKLPIRCPRCGNRGQRRGEWEKHAAVPFKLVEDVVRSFEFAPSIEKDGHLALLADVETDDVDWESGTGLRLECMQCFGDFPLPESAEVDFG